MCRQKILWFTLVAFLAVTAGCFAHEQGSISVNPVDDSSLAAEASIDGDEIGQDSDLVSTAIENGSVTTTDRRGPLDIQLPVRHDGAFYDLSYTETGTEGYRGGVSIDYNASSVDGETVGYADLPAVDQAALDRLLASADTDRQLRPGYDADRPITYTGSEANASVLVPEQEYTAVRYNGESYPIQVSASEETLTVYRYNATRVADSADAYTTALRDNYAFELSNLSDDERDIVDSALNDTAYIEGDDNSGFDSLVDRFQAQQPVTEDDLGGSYVVRYDGRVHWVEINYGPYDDK